MPDWKRTEPKIAALLGGVRVPVCGRARGDQPDIKLRWLSVKVKHRKIIPAWLLEALGQAKVATAGNQLPIAVLHQHGDKYADSLIVIRIRDLYAFIGKEELLDVLDFPYHDEQEEKHGSTYEPTYA